MSGIVRPSPASILLLPTVRNCFFRSTWFQRKWRISVLRIPRVQRRHHGRADREGSSFARCFNESLLLLRRADSRTGLAPLQFESLLLPQSKPDQVAAFTKQPQEKTDLLVGCDRRHLLPQTLFPIFEYGVLVGVDNHFRSQNPRDVTNDVLNERCAAVAQDVAVKVVLRNLANRMNPLLLVVFDGVEAFFKLLPALLLGELGDCLRGWFGRLLDPPPGKPEFVRSDFTSLENGHRTPLAMRYLDMSFTVPR